MVMSFKEFSSAADRGNLITLSRRMRADLDTPVSALLKMGDQDHGFLLESMEGGERWGRYSFLGTSPLVILESAQDCWELRRRGSKPRQIETGTGSVLIPLQEEMRRFQLVPDPALPRLCGGAVGYLGYDMVRFFEKIPDGRRPGLPFPDSFFGIYDRLIIFDNLQHAAFAVVNAYIDGKEKLKKVYEKALRDLDRLSLRFQSSLKTAPRRKKAEKLRPWKASMDEKKYSEAVLKAKEYIKAGDIFQVVLSTRWQVRGRVDPFELYRFLRALNPSPYLFYLKMDDFSLVGSSPEVMVRLEGRRAVLRPIAGTRRRGRTVEEDRRMEKEILEDPKERAEHIMLVDLGRNDLGRVCDPGSVRVNELMTVERYSHVMHLVSNVEGDLKKGKDAFDVIRACFPAGTLTGAPKIRAMEIIEELEPVRRGPYGGCVGYIDFAGNLDTAITIRSVALTPENVYVQAGAGIVYDSIPEREYMECRNKAGAMMEAIKMCLGERMP
jgi:anthranilate synthase component I